MKISLPKIDGISLLIRDQILSVHGSSHSLNNLMTEMSKECCINFLFYPDIAILKKQTWKPVLKELQILIIQHIQIVDIILFTKAVLLSEQHSH